MRNNKVCTRTEYIERNSFIAEQRHLYCDNCERRKGMKNGKMKFVYAIGEVPCCACDIGDMLDSVEDYPAADVAPVRHGLWNIVDESELRRYGCSECKRMSWDKTPYCPNCGALMDKDGDGDV